MKTLLPLLLLIPHALVAQYTQVAHRDPAPGEVPVSAPGSYGEPGTTYILVNDISAPKSALFLGKDVTLDLNGYTITYADGGYGQVPNESFEEGLEGWDLSKAPSARIEDRKVHVFIGDHILRLAKGEEIASAYISLPLASRSYLAYCGVTRMDMRVSVFVEDGEGKTVTCVTEYADSTRVSCPVLNRSPRLGGGFVFAHLNRLPEGKYRVRVRAETDCLIDYVGIRPSMDVGIGIAGETHPMGHNDHLYERAHSAFFDYTADVKRREPLPGIPRVTGTGTVTIRNGTIRNAVPGMLSWGIQSTAPDVMVVIDNLSILASGINSTAVDVPWATITHCTFDVDNPFIINRHGAEFYAVDITGEKPSEVSGCAFYGGQGCLSFKGNLSRVHHNFFANRQTVTNHYSIMAMGDSSLIFGNRIEPEIGSGIEIYVHRGIEIFDNLIRIKASPPTCEYGHEDYSTAAVRIADYGAKPGSANGCFGNKVYNNKFFITGMDFPEFTDYIPMAWAIFYSASGGDNFIFGNRIEVEDLSPGAKNETSAFYIGGGAVGGQFVNNHITTNVPAIWVASRYGGAKETRISGNRIVRSATAGSDFVPFRMGWTGWAGCVAENVRFSSNEITGAPFAVDATGQPHSYTVSWTLRIRTTDRKGNPAGRIPVTIQDCSGKTVDTPMGDAEGNISVELPEYTFWGGEKHYSSPYTLVSGKNRMEVTLDKNREVTLQTR